MLPSLAGTSAPEFNHLAVLTVPAYKWSATLIAGWMMGVHLFDSVRAYRTDNMDCIWLGLIVRAVNIYPDRHFNTVCKLKAGLCVGK